jgi:hypothetical protein
MDAVECNRGGQAAPAPSLLLLLGGLPPGPEDNATFIHRAFSHAGWTVRALHLDTLRLGPEGGILAQATDSGRYALLQREIAGAEEWRILVAGDRVLGAYERRPGTSQGGWNLAAGGTAHLTPLPGDLATRAQALGLQLARAGIGYAGIDVRGGMLLEANVINPGGLATLAALGQPVAEEALVSAITAAAQHRTQAPVLTP